MRSLGQSFLPGVKGPDVAKRNLTLEEQPNFFEAVRRTLYRYFKCIIFPRKDTSKVPAFFANYLDITNIECMYINAILKAWDPVHHKRCGWYIDCPPKKTLAFDVAMRDKLQPNLSKVLTLTSLEGEAASQVLHKDKGKGPSRAGKG